MTEALVAAPEATGRLAGVLSWMARRPRLILALFCLILWGPGVFSMPPLDRDESRFAQASKQMLETGDLVDIRFGAVPRYKKPVGIYWMQAAATEITGLGERTHIWTYRLPSLIGGIIAVWLTFWCAAGFASRQTALLAAALLGGTLLLTGEATIATTDAVLTACIVGAQAVLMRVYLAHKADAAMPLRWLVLAGWAAFGLAVLVKGPVILAITGLTVVGLSIWDRDLRWLKGTRPLTGLLVLLIIVAPWILAIGFKSHWQFFQQSLGQDFATKLQGGQESHGAPPGYFLALVSITFWPAILFLLPGLGAAIRARTEPAMRFLLVWSATWVLFELVPTKLPHYVLPVYPALAILAAVWAMKPRDAAGPAWEKALYYIAPFQFAIASLALAAAPMILPAKYGSGTIWWVLGPVAVFSALWIGALVAYLRRSLVPAVLCAVAAPLVLYAPLTAGVGPQLTQLWVSPRAAAAERALQRADDPPPSLAGYVEPSLVFLLGTKTRQTDGRSAAEAGVAQGGLALVEDSERNPFQARLAELEADAVEVGAVDGFNYSRGRKVHIRIFRVAPVREMPAPPAE